MPSVHRIAATYGSAVPCAIRMNAMATSNAMGTGRKAAINATATIPMTLTCPVSAGCGMSFDGKGARHCG